MLSKHRSFFILVILLSLSLALPRASSAAPAPSMTILSPGSGSALTSPIPVSALVQPGADGLIRLTLTDQANRTISRQLIRVAPAGEEEISLETQLLFEVPYPGVEGLLTLSTQDEFHRPLAQRSVLLTLNAGGETEIQPNPVSGHWLEIHSPEPGAALSGGSFTIAGTITPATDQPVRFELITDSGGQIGSAQLAVGEPGQTVPFEITISYGFISTARDVRLVIRQTLADYSANLLLDSLPLTLAP